MEREFRIKDKDLLKDNHFPIQAIFNMVSDERFIKVIEGISQGKGFGENYGACVFEGDLDEYELETNGAFDGAEFGLHSGQEIIIDYKSLEYYLKIICNEYILDFPESKSQLNQLLKDFEQRFICIK
jgi:hypothetical protein